MGQIGRQYLGTGAIRVALSVDPVAQKQAWYRCGLEVPTCTGVRRQGRKSTPSTSSGQASGRQVGWRYRFLLNPSRQRCRDGALGTLTCTPGSAPLCGAGVTHPLSRHFASALTGDIAVPLVPPVTQCRGEGTQRIEQVFYCHRPILWRGETKQQPGFFYQNPGCLMIGKPEIA